MPRPPTVLVVEDEAIVRMGAVDVLLDAGFDVVEADDGHQAVQFLEVHAEAIAAVFTDVDMPGHPDGVGLVYHAATHWPWIKLVVTSGVTKTLLGELPAAARFIAKPYRADELVDQLSELLEE